MFGYKESSKHRTLEHALFDWGREDSNLFGETWLKPGESVTRGLYEGWSRG